MAANEVQETGCFVGTVTINLYPNVDYPTWISNSDEKLPCFEAGPDLFFPEAYGRAYHKEIDKARALCGTCPMLEPCRDWAIPKPNLDGIWAGTTPKERRRIRNGKQKVA